MEPQFFELLLWRGPGKPCGQLLVGLTSWRVMSSVGFTYGYPSSAPGGAA
jgi:hypothetical protein